MQLVAELPLVPRICTLSCETDKQREWRSVLFIFDENQPCSNTPFKHTRHLRTSCSDSCNCSTSDFGVRPVFSSSLPCVGMSWAEKWNPHCLLAPEVNGKVTLIETGSAKDFIRSGMFLRGLHKFVF